MENSTINRKFDDSEINTIKIRQIVEIFSSRNRVKMRNAKKITLNSLPDNCSHSCCYQKSLQYNKSASLQWSLAIFHQVLWIPLRYTAWSQHLCPVQLLQGTNRSSDLHCITSSNNFWVDNQLNLLFCFETQLTFSLSFIESS